MTTSEFLREMTPGLKLSLVEDSNGPRDSARTVAAVHGDIVGFHITGGGTAVLDLDGPWMIEEEGDRFILTHPEYPGRVAYR